MLLSTIDRLWAEPMDYYPAAYEELMETVWYKVVALSFSFPVAKASIHLRDSRKKRASWKVKYQMMKVNEHKVCQFDPSNSS